MLCGRHTSHKASLTYIAHMLHTTVTLRLRYVQIHTYIHTHTQYIQICLYTMFVRYIKYISSMHAVLVMVLDAASLSCNTV